MKYCQKCGTQIEDKAVICPCCGCPSGDYNPYLDDISVGLCILSFFIPFFALIYMVIMAKRAPNRARACGIAAIAGMIVAFVLSVMGAFSLYNSINETLTNYGYYDTNGYNGGNGYYSGNGYYGY